MDLCHSSLYTGEEMEVEYKYLAINLTGQNARPLCIERPRVGCTFSGGPL